MSYKVVIGVPINGFERFFELDTVISRDVDNSMTLATQPIQDGRSVTDHSYRNPTQENLSGTFSVRGSWTITGDSYTRKNMFGNEDPSAFLAGEGSELRDITDNGSRLHNIQTFWEWVMKRGILSDIYMMNYDEKNSGAPRFKVRRNMALQRVTWKENYDNMAYTFSFQEIQTVGVSKFEQFDISMYPSVTMPETKTLGEVICDTDNIAKSILQILLEGGYIKPEDALAYTKKFETAQKALRESIGSQIGSSIGNAGKVALALVIGEALVAASMAGTIAVGIALGIVAVSTVATVAVAIPVAGFVIAGIVFGVMGIIALNKKKEQEKKAAIGFNLLIDYEKYFVNGELQTANLVNSEENISDIIRLQKLLNEIETAIKNEFANVQIYQISNSTTDNGNRSFAVSIGNEIVYGCIESELDYERGRIVKPKYRLSLFDSPSEDAKALTVYHQWAPVTDFSTASRNRNVIYVDSTGEYEMYLVNMNLALQKAEDPDPLSNYCIMVNKGNIEDTWNRLQTTIIETLQNNEFEV